MRIFCAICKFFHDKQTFSQANSFLVVVVVLEILVVVVVIVVVVVVVVVLVVVICSTSPKGFSGLNFKIKLLQFEIQMLSTINYYKF